MSEVQFWIDKLSDELIKREETLGRKISNIRTECGVGLSGVAHIGSLSDVLRHYGVTLGLRDRGFKSEMIAFADDRDGLRKVPAGFPEKMKEDIGKPVTDIEDPFGCHKSFGDHARGIWLEAAQQVGVTEFTHISSTEAYTSGMFDRELALIMENYKIAGEIIHRLTGSEKYLDVYPYFPVCKQCGRVYTTRVTNYDPKTKAVKYVCDQEFEGKVSGTGQQVIAKGCGFEGESKITKSTGKTMWKVDWGVRWSALKICFEAHGKELASSAEVSDEICKKILNFDPPLHMVYELFLDKGGSRISKSSGNVFTPQVWMKYGTPQSLRLLMFKRFEGARELGVVDIPKYMDEVDALAKVYFGKTKVSNERDLLNMKRLYEYITFLKPAKVMGMTSPYQLLTYLLKVAPVGKEAAFIEEKLKGYGMAVDKKELEARIKLTTNWNTDMEEEAEPVQLDAKEKAVMKEIAAGLEKASTPEDIQKAVFESIKKSGIEPKNFFPLIYKVLLNVDQGPRLGPLISDIGAKKAAKMINERLK